jgi:hypothetical protein
MNLTETDEAEFLFVMAMQATEEEQARAACGELFVRNRRYLFAVVSRSYGSILRDDGTADLVCDVFQRA